MINKGFTLIELLAVFTIVGFLTIFGVASFNSFNEEQAFRSASIDVVRVLSLARSRAVTQTKPPECLDAGTGVNKILEGYRVDIKIAESSYALFGVCEGSDFEIERHVLPNHIEFVDSGFGNNFSFFFNVSKGSVVPVGSIKLSGYKGDKMQAISLGSNGGVSIE